MAILGTKYSAYLGTYTPILGSTENQVAVVQPEQVAPAHGFGIRLGAFLRRTSAAANIWLGLHALNADGSPGLLLCRTDRLPVPSSGTDLSGEITWVNPAFGDVASSLRLIVSQQFALSVKVESGNVEIAGAQNGGTTTHYLRTYLVDNAPPTSPFNAASTATRPTLALYLEFVENSPPTVSLLLPADVAVLNTSAPTFTGTFDDANESAPTLDRIFAYAIEVREVTLTGTNPIVWGGVGAVFPASAEERAAGAFSRLYTGPVLNAAKTYQWRAEVYDDSGSSSGWSAPRTFTINAQGRVDTATDGAPTGKVDTPSANIDWSGRWSHPLLHFTDRLQVIIYRNGSLFRVGNEVVQGVSGLTAFPGTFFTIDDTVAGIGVLPAGAYTYTIRGRSATDGQWGNQSDQRQFIVNALPTKPSNLQPPPGSPTTALPLLEWFVDDLDDDDVFGIDDDSELEIIRPNGVSFSAFSASYDAARGVGFYQVTPSEFNMYGTFKWRVRGRDISAGGNGLGAWSDYSTVTYLAGPVVTITNPTNLEVEATSVPTITWTVTGGVQQSARVIMYNKDNPLPFRAQVVAGAAGVFQIPVGWLVNGGEYDVAVEVFAAGGIMGTSLRRGFSVAYTNPNPPRNVAATGAMERRDYHASPSSILVSWDMTQYPPGEFAGYVLTRRLASQRAQDATVLRTLISPGQNRWRDYWAPSGIPMIYGVSQLRRVGSELLESPVTEVNAEINLKVPILESAYDANTYRFPLMYLEADYASTPSRPDAAFVTWGSRNRKTFVTTPAEDESQSLSLSVTIKSDERGTMYDHLSDAKALVRCGHPLHFRPEWHEESFYCRMVAPKWRRGGVGERILSFTLEEIDFTPGESGGS